MACGLLAGRPFQNATYIRQAGPRNSNVESF